MGASSASGGAPYAAAACGRDKGGMGIGDGSSGSSGMGMGGNGGMGMGMAGSVGGMGGMGGMGGPVPQGGTPAGYSSSGTPLPNRSISAPSAMNGIPYGGGGAPPSLSPRSASMGAPSPFDRASSAVAASPAVMGGSLARKPASATRGTPVGLPGASGAAAALAAHAGDVAMLEQRLPPEEAKILRLHEEVCHGAGSDARAGGDLPKTSHPLDAPHAEPRADLSDVPLSLPGRARALRRSCLSYGASTRCSRTRCSRARPRWPASESESSARLPIARTSTSMARYPRPRCHFSRARRCRQAEEPRRSHAEERRREA